MRGGEDAPGHQHAIGGERASTAKVRDLLSSGKSFADLSGWRKLGVSGAESLTWLDSLVAADLSGLAPGLSIRTLLLTADGRLCADVTVAVVGGSIVVLQDPEQSVDTAGLLAPHIGSTDVALDDRTDGLCLFAFPGRAAPPDVAGSAACAPSCLGAGSDLLALRADHERLTTGFRKAFTAAPETAVAEWRVVAGGPHTGIDVLPGDLPVDAGLGDLAGAGSGNGHFALPLEHRRDPDSPRMVVLALASAAPVQPGDLVLSDGVGVGVVTSVAGSDDGDAVLYARVRADSPRTNLATDGGVLLRARPDSPAGATPPDGGEVRPSTRA